jgi:hypothetical protein
MDVLLFIHGSYGTYCGQPMVELTVTCILKRKVILGSFG